MSSMAQRLGGRLELDNAPSGGARVTVLLPAPQAG
jgi:signal transduction histidine kinase